MAYEVTHWKQSNCSLSLKIDRFSKRETFSREINQTYGEGGALNANYRTTEAALRIANILGLAGLTEGTHFVFKTGGMNCVSFDFCDQSALARASKALLFAPIAK